MKQALTLVALLVLSTVHAQLTGKIVDEKGIAVGFANIGVLRQADSTLAASGIADKEGRFSLPAPPAGSYFLRITAIGLSETKTPAFEVGSGAFNKNFGDIALITEAKALNDVSVTALRPAITQLADRMIVAVQGTAMAAGNTAFSLLGKAPGIFIDAEGNIQLNGRAGVLVMIDGRRTWLSATDLRTLLEGMSAENVKNIEIITNPSSKYDAEGTSGIININLKRNLLNGINGSTYSSYNYNFYQQHGATAGGNINVKHGNWNAFAMLDFARRVGGRNATFTRVFNSPGSSTFFDQVAVGDFEAQGPPSLRSGADYTINPNHSLGFLFNFATNTARSSFLTDTWIGGAPKTYSQFIDANNYNKNTYTNYTGNLHYTGKFDSAGTTLSTDFDYVRISNRGDAYLYNYFTDLTTNQTTTDFLYNHTPNDYNIYSAKLDFTLPVKKGAKFEAGGRASKVVTENNYQFFFDNGVRLLDLSRTNHFKYCENIFAGYLNWSGTINPKLSFQTGLRAEQTVSVGHSFTTNQTNRRSYLNLFPSAFLTQKVNDNYTINYSYSRRLTRPNYGNLNPFRAYRDPYTWYEGNTGLRPQYTHFFSVGQVIRKTYNITLSYQLNKDVMAEIPILFVADTTTVYTTGNVDDGHSASLSLVGPFKLAKKWDSQNTLLLNYSRFSMQSNNGHLVNEGLFAMLQSNHTILLPRDFRLEVNIILRGPAASGLYQMASMHREDLALKKSFNKKKFDLSLNVNDIFKGFRYYWTTDINGNVNDFDQYFRLRTIGATLRYNFSRGQKVNVKQRSTPEEVNRT